VYFLLTAPFYDIVLERLLAGNVIIQFYYVLVLESPEHDLICEMILHQPQQKR